MNTGNKLIVIACLLAAASVAVGQRSFTVDAADRLYYEAHDFFLLKNYAGATDKLEAYKKVSTNSDLLQEADYMLAYIAFDEGKPYAVEALETYLKDYPDSRHSDEACLLIGKGWFERDDYQKAEYYLSQADPMLLRAEQSDELFYRLAYSLMQNKNYEAARRYFSLVSEYSLPYSQAATYNIAYIDYSSKKYDDALKGFNRIRKNPEYAEKAGYYITQINFFKEKYDEVVNQTERLLRNFPNNENNTELYRISGSSYYHLGNQDRAVEMLRKYIAAVEKPARSEMYILGVCEYNRGEYADAAKTLSQTVTDDDRMGQNASLYLGHCYLQQGDKNKARMAFENAASLTFDKKVQESALYNYALLVHETEFSGFGESVKAFEKFLNDFPGSQYTDKVNDYLVEVYLTSKNYQAALESINKIRQPSTKVLEAKQNILFQLGNQAFTNNSMPDAIDYFTQTINMGAYESEISADAYFWRGESYYRLEKYTDAISDYNTFRSLSRLSESNATSLVYYNLGYCYFKRQEFSQALVSFRRYATLEQNQEAYSLADAYNRIGDCLYKDRQFSEAVTNYTRAATLQPAFADHAIYQKGFSLGLLKDYKGKIQQMDRIISEFPQSQYLDDALYERGRTYVLIDKPEEAATSFSTLMARFPASVFSPKAGIQLGLLYYNENQLEKSVEAYKKVIADYPGSEEAKVAVQDLKSVYIDLNDVSSYAQYVNSLGGSMQIEVSEQDSLTFLAAEKLYLKGDFEGARRSLLSYTELFKGGAFVSNANYYLGKIAFDRKEYDVALPLFTAVLASGDVKYREEALARKSEIEYMNKDYSAAIKTFRELQSVAETRENREAAKLGVMRCAQYTGNETEALEAADALLKDNNNLSPEIEAEARYLRAKAHLRLNQPDKAVGDLTALSKDTRTAYGAEAKYRLVQYYYDTKDLARAEKEAQNFMSGGTPHQYWLARSCIVLADIFIDKGDPFQARQYLVSLKRNYGGKSEDIDRMIEERLEKIKNR